MKSYQVTWGSVAAVVIAADETEAWANFCQKHDLASRQPKLFEREIVEIDADQAEAVAASAPATSPVAGQNADEAIDHINRMRSADKLQEIIDADTRVTVTEAARRRLTEIGGS